MAGSSSQVLKREVGFWGAVLLGLGSILGTGVFVSIGIAAGVAGPAVILAVPLGAGVAACNGLSSAQLAASHPVSGGTYEYGYRYLNPWLGFIAGWMFLLAKSASAATAALGFSGYLLAMLDRNEVVPQLWLVPIALLTVLIVTLITLGGIRRSGLANASIVSFTLVCLGFLILVGIPRVIRLDGQNFQPFFGLPTEAEIAPLPALLQSTALMFVAFTGYGRIATLGEEVRQPQRTIPQAILLTLILSAALYLAVALVGVGTVGAAALSQATQIHSAPLEVVARSFGIPGGPKLLALGAMTAMLGVLLNLVLGLSRVLLAMGRRRDMPGVVARLNTHGTTPSVAVLVMSSVIALLVLVGNVKTTWAFSAFNVLVYYAITNLAALRLPPDQQRYPHWVAALGLLCCLLLAFWVDSQVWLAGLGLIGLGLLWKLGRSALAGN